MGIMRGYWVVRPLAFRVRPRPSINLQSTKDLGQPATFLCHLKKFGGLRLGCIDRAATPHGGGGEKRETTWSSLRGSWALSVTSLQGIGIKRSLCLLPLGNATTGSSCSGTIRWWDCAVPWDPFVSSSVVPAAVLPFDMPWGNSETLLMTGDGQLRDSVDDRSHEAEAEQKIHTPDKEHLRPIPARRSRRDLCSWRYKRRSMAGLGNNPVQVFRT
jgi:hypothetical protein